VYYAAKHDLPNLQVNSLLHLQRMNGVKCNFVDISEPTLVDVQESIAFVLDGELKCGIANSGYFGLIVDESTDIAVHKKLAACVRYVADWKMVTKFLTNVQIQSGTAESIVG